MGFKKGESRNGGICIACKINPVDRSEVGKNRSWCKPCRADLHIYLKYKLLPRDYDNLLASQGGVCGICQKPWTKRLQVDHDHDTGKVRGLLCQRCNSFLGFLIDDRLYQQALAYLKRSEEGE